MTNAPAPFDMSLPAVSKHLRVLERAGLVSQRRDAQATPPTKNNKKKEKPHGRSRRGRK